MNNNPLNHIRNIIVRAQIGLALFLFTYAYTNLKTAIVWAGTFFAVQALLDIIVMVMDE